MSADARRAFLERLIDDAGLFPPASLPMAEALATHADNCTGPLAWMLGRFLCPASRMEELAAELPERLTHIRVGAILDGASTSGADSFLAAFETDIDRVATVAASDDRIAVDAIEVRLQDTEPDSAAAVLDMLDDSGMAGPITPYIEPVRSTDTSPLVTTVDMVAALLGDGAGDRPVCGAPGAKIRCGGATAELMPPADAIAAFVDRCIARHVPFKATAGLHHPYRTPDTATGAHMHGFLNVAGGTALRHAGLVTLAELAVLIADDDRRAIVLDGGGFRWRDRSVGAPEIHHTRSVAFHAFGSCSFDEPVSDLVAAGVL